MQSAISRFFNREVEQNGIVIYLHKELYGERGKEGMLVVQIGGFGTGVFGKPQGNVFVNPDDIKPEQIAYFIGQLIKAKVTYDKNISISSELSVFNILCNDCDNNNMEFIVYSASAGSFFALSSFLKNNEGKQKFFQEVVAKLFPDVEEEQKRELQQKSQKLMKYIAQEVNFINPPGILFHAGLANYFDLKTQSVAVGEQGLASEKYFIKMISEYLSGGFQLSISPISSHNDLTLFTDIKNAISSSIVDEAVFPFYYVAMFAKELKSYNVGDDKKISEFVYKVMQYGDVKNEDQIEKYYDEIFERSAITYKNMAETLATKYLKIRDDYLSAQNENNWEIFKKKATTIFAEYKPESSNPSASCQATRPEALNVSGCGI